MFYHNSVILSFISSRVLAYHLGTLGKGYDCIIAQCLAYSWSGDSTWQGAIGSLCSLSGHFSCQSSLDHTALLLFRDRNNHSIWWYTSTVKSTLPALVRDEVEMGRNLFLKLEREDKRGYNRLGVFFFPSSISSMPPSEETSNKFHLHIRWHFHFKSWALDGCLEKRFIS